MSATNTETHLPAATSRELEASGQHLEACTVVEGDGNVLVRVFRVNYGIRPLPESPMRVVRSFKWEHFIRTAPRIVFQPPGLGGQSICPPSGYILLACGTIPQATAPLRHVSKNR